MNYFLCLISSTFVAICGIFIKQYQFKTGNIKNTDHVFNAIISIIATVFFAVTGIFSDGIAINAEFMPYSVLYAAGYVIGTVGCLCAMSRGSLLITVIMSQMGCLVPILCMLILYGEKPALAAVTGMALLIIALFLFHMQKEKGEKSKPFFWLFAFMSFLGNGISMLAVKIQQYNQPDMYQSALLFYGMALTAATFVVIVALKPPKTQNGSYKGCTKVIAGATVWAVLYGLCNGAANYLNALVVNKLPTIAFYMCATGFGILLSFFIARFIYREKLLLNQYIGCVIATAGLILIMAF